MSDPLPQDRLYLHHIADAIAHSSGAIVDEVASLTDDVRATILARALDVELDLDALRIEPILNWGGFVNRSFRLSDGRRQYFLKLSRDPDGRHGLGRWHSLAEIIENRYHGPHMVAWLEVGSTGYAGALFEWLDGAVVDHLDGDLKARVSRVVTRLHADDALADRLLEAGDRVVPCAEAYLRSYHDRFSEDLAFVAADPPPFLPSGRLEWMEREADGLASRVREAASFRSPADRPIHADLWANNVLVDRDGHWYLLDWDGLRLGDPVMDWAMLFGPSREHARALDEEEVSASVPLGESERQRLRLYARASLLDWVIDPLADWVQAGSEPQHGEQVRLANRRVHEEAFEEYARRYGE
jgi:fructosamine-3-kinase